MLKKLLSVMLAATVVSQGIARAEELAHGAGVLVATDRVALLAQIEGLAEGDRIADDLVMDRPLLDGRGARVAIPRQEIQGFRYQPGIVPHATPIPWKTVAVLAAVVAAGALLTSLLVSKSSRR